MTDERCTYSDLWVDICAHCLGHGDLPIGLEPSVPEPPRATGRVVWSPSMTKEPRQPISEPRRVRTGQSATAVITGPQNGQNECVCGKPTRDNAVICDDCTNMLERAIGDVAWIAEELDVSMTRQRSAPIVSGAPSASHGLPWHEKAAEAIRELRSLLVLWVRMCDEEGIGTGPSDLPADNLPAIAGWLLHRVPGIARHDAAADALDEITNAVAECERVIFWKRRSRLYLGTCGQRVEDDEGVTLMDACTGEVYANEGEQVGICDLCAQGVTVVVRQGDLNRQLDDRLCTAGELARLAVILGLDAPRDSVRKKIHYWHRHKRIVQRGTITTHEKGQPVEVPTFRYGEVRVMLYAEFARNTA